MYRDVPTRSSHPTAKENTQEASVCQLFFHEDSKRFARFLVVFLEEKVWILQKEITT